MEPVETALLWPFGREGVLCCDASLGSVAPVDLSGSGGGVMLWGILSRKLLL